MVRVNYLYSDDFFFWKEPSYGKANKKLKRQIQERADKVKKQEKKLSKLKKKLKKLK